MTQVYPRRLWQKLALSLTVIMTLVGMVEAFVQVKTQEQQLLNAMIQGADQLSGSIASATWHAMLADHRTDVYRTMETIAQKQGIARIRIFNKEGHIMFSTVRGDTGQVDKAAEACFMCHSAEYPLVEVDVPTRSRIVTTAEHRRQLGTITPIYNEPSCSEADCHAHPRSQKVLGVIDVTLTLDAVDQEIAKTETRVAVISLVAVLLMAVFGVLYTRYFVERPIQKLVEATRAVSAMKLDAPVEIDSSTELGELAESFNAMRMQLLSAREENYRIMENLESKVQERTEQLNAAQQKLLQTDRLASLGTLAASVAHEINNPLGGVLNLAMLMQRILKDDGVPAERLEEYRKYLSQVIHETSRVGRIVQDLLAFSRRSKPQRTHTDMNAIARTTGNLLNHKLKLMNVELTYRLDPDLPSIDCDVSQMQQVLINLVMNSAESTQAQKGGWVSVHTNQHPTQSAIVLEVRDNGDGISPEHLRKIFEPFYTTKGEGKGTGLGLAVVYGIVAAHRGEIDVHGPVGEGTTIMITLPREASAADSERIVSIASQGSMV